ncbi:MAG: energy transducer TonB [Rubrivivax sp.]|nr:energy transducer TonB [Rubrivivax sp.]
MSATPSLPPAPGADWAHALRRPAEVSRSRTWLLVAATAALHLGAGWALLQVPEVRQAVLQAAPMMVEVLAAPAPQPPAPPPPAPAPQPPQRPAVSAPVLAAPSPTPLAVETFTVPAPPPTPTTPVAEAAPAPVLAPAAPPAPPPPARKLLPATAVHYLVQPPVEVPRASRRAGESGVVWLRVVVDVRGLPAQVRVQRSSGHTRLDEQALWAMRQARFQPHTQDGAAIEVEVVAPIEYPLE